MTGQEFRAWRKRLGLTQEQAATALGYALRRITDMEGGKVIIPRVVELAAWRLEEHPEDIPNKLDFE